MPPSFYPLKITCTEKRRRISNFRNVRQLLVAAMEDQLGLAELSDPEPATDYLGALMLKIFVIDPVALSPI